MGSVVALSPEPRYFATHAYATEQRSDPRIDDGNRRVLRKVGDPDQRGRSGT